MTAPPGGFDVIPDELDQAAELLEQAAGEVDIAGDRIGEGTAPAAAFGRSVQAMDLAAKWEAAVQARVAETWFSANETRRLAEELRTYAEENRALEEGNKDRFGN